MKKIKWFFRDIVNSIRYKYQRMTRGYSDKDCWDLDYYLIKIINNSYKTYLEQASEVVDLSVPSIKYKNQEFSRMMLIKTVIALTDELLEPLEKDNFGSLEEYLECCKTQEEVFDILKVLNKYMNW